MRNLNKIALNSALVMALLGIWGWILYSALERESNPSPLQLPVTDTQTTRAPEENSYTPNFDYADPFLKQALPIKPIIQRPPMEKKPSKSVQRTPWPSVRYFGLIRNSSRGRTLGLITVDERSHLISAGSHLGEITIRSYNADSAVLALHDEIRSFKITLQ